MKELDSLNDEQRQAVLTTDGPLLVLAGAGTGKTRVVTTRIAYLLSKGVRPEEILAITFTRKAADEMKERVVELVSNKSKGLTVCTFHALGRRILVEHGHRVGLRKRFGIVGEEQQREIVEEVIASEKVLGLLPFEFIAQIEQVKSGACKPTGRFETAYEKYQAILRDRNAVDFEDLMALPLSLFHQFPECGGIYQRRWKYLLVDEYQDTNSSQFELVCHLLGKHRNLCVVGDDDQSIYGFRGSEVERILSFGRDFTGSRVVKLETNYRCSEQILKLANAVIAGAKTRYPKTLRSHLGPQEPVYLKRTKDEKDEFAFVAEKIQEERAESRETEIAVLARTQQQVELYRTRLKQLGYVGKGNKVSVMTLHQSKGLEFQVVFLPSLNDETIPHLRAVLECAEAVEEERRLLYVGITRAKRRLYLSSARSVQQREVGLSRFLDGLRLGSAVSRA